MSQDLKICKNSECQKEIPYDGTTRVTCNDECRKLYNVQKQRSYRRKKSPLNGRLCKECRKPLDINSGRTTYCSDVCGKKGKKKVDAIHYEKANKRKRKQRFDSYLPVVCAFEKCYNFYIPNKGKKYCCGEHREMARTLKLRPVRHVVCNYDNCNNEFYTTSSTLKYCKLDSCGGKRKITKKKVPTKNTNRTRSTSVPKKVPVATKEQNSVFPVNARTTKKPKVVIDLTHKDDDLEMALPESVINDPLLYGIPTINGMPKYVRKDRRKEVVAPRDGTYGDRDQELIAKFLAEQKG